MPSMHPAEPKGTGAQPLPGTTAVPSASSQAIPAPPCRFCAAPLVRTFVDLGMSPLCESYLAADQLNAMEPFYPLHVRTCDRCLLVQLEQYVAPEEIFTEYAYFSSYSDTWLAHAAAYAEKMVSRFGLGPGSKVVEVASNDGYLLRNFVRMGIPCLGSEPAVNVARVAVEQGVPTLTEFFGRESARSIGAEHGRADLVLGNNVLAQVPDLNDFVGGIKILLADRGVATLEFPHLMQLVQGNQLDTIYHEHFSYFSFYTVERIFAEHGIPLFDVEELPTHGGSLRIYARHDGDTTKPETDAVRSLRRKEQEGGFDRIEGYLSFAGQVEETKRALLSFLIGTKRAGKTIAGYGAPGKGNTLLNYCGVRTDFVDYTVDRNPYKQGKFLPGTHIPIRAPERIRETKPDFVLILPWNFRDEIIRQNAFIREWGGRFVVPIPTVTIVP